MRALICADTDNPTALSPDRLAAVIQGARDLVRARFQRVRLDGHVAQYGFTRTTQSLRRRKCRRQSRQRLSLSTLSSTTSPPVARRIVPRAGRLVVDGSPFRGRGMPTVADRVSEVIACTAGRQRAGTLPCLDHARLARATLQGTPVRTARYWSISIEGDGRSDPRTRGLSMGESTVEGKVRAELARRLGGPRGSVETAAPVVIFTLVYMVTQQTRTALVAALFAGVSVYALRLLQRSETTFARHGLIGIIVAAVLVSITGQAETAFLPGLVQNAVWALALGTSLAIRWPAAGFVIGAVLDDITGWRTDSAMVKLAYRLTLILLAPIVVRLSIQVPLYLAGEVAWLGTSRIILGWPLHAATLAVAGLVLVRGKTPLPDPDR
jgi:hypothetical protein